MPSRGSKVLLDEEATAPAGHPDVCIDFPSQAQLFQLGLFLKQIDNRLVKCHLAVASIGAKEHHRSFKTDFCHFFQQFIFLPLDDCIQHFSLSPLNLFAHIGVHNYILHQFYHFVKFCALSSLMPLVFLS